MFPQVKLSDVFVSCFHKSSHDLLVSRLLLHILMNELRLRFSLVSTDNVSQLCGPLQRKLSLYCLFILAGRFGTFLFLVLYLCDLVNDWVLLSSWTDFCNSGW